MIMSVKSPKNKSIADKISEFLAPKALLDPEKDHDESNCQFSEFDKESYDNVQELGQIRKRNVQSLDKVHAKYEGVPSKRSLDDSQSEKESENEDDSGDEEESEADFESESDNPEESGDDNEEFDDDESEEDDDGDMFAGLEQEPSETTDILPTTPKTSETYQKSISVKNQLEIWEKLLEVRIKSHKLLLTANSMPLPQTHNQLSSSTEFSGAVEKTFKGVEVLLTQLQDFQQLMCSRFPETKELPLQNLKSRDPKKRKSTSKDAPESKVVKLESFTAAISENYNTLKEYSQPVLQKWHDRTNIIHISKTKQLGSVNLIKNIENSLINRSELVKKTQVYRGGYEVFDLKSNLDVFTTNDGKNVSVDDIAGENLKESVNKLVCPEIFDDSDFYHQLLRELIQSKSGDNEGQLEITKKYQELQKLRRKMKKTVDTRASKGRKIRYVVHNKMMNFMAPTVHEKWSDESKDELYSSLFGQADKMK